MLAWTHGPKHEGWATGVKLRLKYY